MLGNIELNVFVITLGNVEPLNIIFIVLLENANIPIELTLSGIIIDFNPGLFSNALFPIVFNEFDNFGKINILLSSKNNDFNEFGNFGNSIN